MTLFFQGDICIERVADVPVSGVATPPGDDGAIVIAEGEATGHRHVFLDAGVTFFRDDALAAGVPADLYVGHVKVGRHGASLVHEEHDAIPLAEGTYRIRRQREFDERLAAQFDHSGRLVRD